MEGLKVVEIPVPKGAKHPPVPVEVLPMHEFSLGIVAPPGSGKTTLICNLIEGYSGYFNRIIVFSPSVRSDDKWDWIKTRNVLVENVALQEALESIKEKDEKKTRKVITGPSVSSGMNGLLDLEIEKSRGRRDENDEFIGTIPDGDYYHDYDQDDLVREIKAQEDLITLLKKHKFTKHVADRTLLIFDDLVGSNLFSNARKNPFKMLSANRRHHSFSMICVSQAYKEIPRAVRVMFSSLIIMNIYSESELEAIYIDFPMAMKKDEWVEAFEYCTEDEFGFMFYDLNKSRDRRLMKDFTQIVFNKED
jgi:hypothetical protein